MSKQVFKKKFQDTLKQEIEDIKQTSKNKPKPKKKSKNEFIDSLIKQYTQEKNQKDKEIIEAIKFRDIGQDKLEYKPNQINKSKLQKLKKEDLVDLGPKNNRFSNLINYIQVFNWKLLTGILIIIISFISLARVNINLEAEESKYYEQCLDLLNLAQTEGIKTEEQSCLRGGILRNLGSDSIAQKSYEKNLAEIETKRNNLKSKISTLDSEIKELIVKLEELKIPNLSPKQIDQNLNLAQIVIQKESHLYELNEIYSQKIKDLKNNLFALYKLSITFDNKKLETQKHRDFIRDLAGLSQLEKIKKLEEIKNRLTSLKQKILEENQVEEFELNFVATSPLLTSKNLTLIISNLDYPKTEITERQVRVFETAEARDILTQILDELDYKKLPEAASPNLNYASKYGMQDTAYNNIQSLITSLETQGYKLEIAGGYLNQENQANIFLDKLKIIWLENTKKQYDEANLEEDQLKEAIKQTLTQTDAPGYSALHTGYQISLKEVSKNTNLNFYTTEVYNYLKQNDYINLLNQGFLPAKIHDDPSKSKPKSSYFELIYAGKENIQKIYENQKTELINL